MPLSSVFEFCFMLQVSARAFIHGSRLKPGKKPYSTVFCCRRRLARRRAAGAAAVAARLAADRRCVEAAPGGRLTIGCWVPTNLCGGGETGVRHPVAARRLAMEKTQGSVLQARPPVSS